MKKKILYLAAVLVGLSLISGGTLAYFTAEDTSRNVITTGGVAASVVQQQLVDGVLQPFSNQPIPVMPNTTVSNVVSVQSTKQPAWVRLKYEITVYDATGTEKPLTAEEVARIVTVTPDSTAWAQVDGWWYCSEAIGFGESTEALFEEISFSGPNMGNDYQGCTVALEFTAQAVQQANNGTTVLEAAGWPEA